MNQEDPFLLADLEQPLRSSWLEVCVGGTLGIREFCTPTRFQYSSVRSIMLVFINAIEGNNSSRQDPRNDYGEKASPRQS